MKIQIIYILLLFIVYRTVFHMADFSINTAIYGLFSILLFFYYLTDNLNFNKKPKYKSIYVNAIIFLIFLFFYKKSYIFVAFLIFTIFQMGLQRCFKKLSIDKEERYNPAVISIRGMGKLILDSTGICAAILLAFVLKYDNHWMEYIKIDYFVIYLSIFLVMYVYYKLSEKSWSYTNMLDVLQLLCLNIITSVIFTIFVVMSKKYSYSFSIMFLTLLISVSSQLFLRFLFRMHRYNKSKRKKGKILKRALIYGAGDAGTILAKESLTKGRELANQLRNVRIEDLLGRDEICINDTGIRSLIEGKTIFVTGGAGSIGSELARQIAKYNPKQLVAIDINENDIYFLELELHRVFPNLKFVSEICNIREREKLEFLFEKYRPNIVFHAAAHKHVPLMEHNPEEAIKNNIFGTKNVAECADKHGVQRMVLISTDKAVNPTNLMGASKRACELVIEHMNKIAKNTKFMAVRFGNVLGSHGSVIPIFRNLLEEGKNLTVTHKDITRYFMTIPEAAQLVIEAGSIGKGGEIFILDMGKPVRIYDLAKSMIKLSNANVGIDIVGLRPGEKLFEELLYDVNNAIKTDNKKIFITKVDGNTDISKFFEKLEECTHNPDVDKIKEVMKEVVVSYKEVSYE